MKLEWRKARNCRFSGNHAGGKYDFWARIPNTDNKQFDIRPIFREYSLDVIGYKLCIAEVKFGTVILGEELGIFDTSIEAKRFAESLI